MLRAALIQLSSSDDPGDNARTTVALLRRAAQCGADIALTPEATNCVSRDRAWQERVLCHEDDDATLAAARNAAAELGIWVLLGSLVLKTDDPDRRFANRSFMIAPNGDIVARYDKLHMFDVQVSAEETFRESASFRAGERAVVARTELADIGMTICYDVRFPQLYRALAKAGAEVLSVPAAFSHETGPAHWETLLRARAIETGCFVLAPAQTGEHRAQAGKRRKTHGHSLAVSPWGEVLADAGTEPGVTMVEIDTREVDAARGRIPALEHDRPFEGPE